MDISVVIPLYNEEESLPELYQWIVRVMDANHFSYEVIFVNDGSTDRSWQVIEDLKKQNPDHVHGIKFRRNYGKSPALFCGFQKAGCRSAGQPRRNTRTVSHDYGRRLRPCVWLEKETLRSPVENDSHKTLQRYRTQGIGHQESARLQLRSEGLPPRRGEEYRSLWRNAPLYSLPGQERKSAKG